MTDTLELPAAGDADAQRSHLAGQVALWGIGTATPPAVTQAEAVELAEEFGARTDGERAWLRRVFMRSGVAHRGTVLKSGEGIDSVRRFYGAPETAGPRGPSTAARMERYMVEAPALGERAARAALDDAGIAPDVVTHLITASCTGFSAPGLDVELIERLHLSRGVRRIHIGFMGCHAAFNALGAARDAIRADPEAVVLVCCVELSTLHFAYGFDPQKLVANALFADGAGACVMGRVNTWPRQPAEGHEAAARRWRLLETASLLLPESRDAMTWRIGDHGFEMTLSSELPALIERHLRPWCEQWLGERGLTINDIKYWAIHPGGPKILSAAGTALGLQESDLSASRAVLSRHGNMSSATVLFLLREILAAANSGLCVAIGFGPGLMAEGMLLET